MSELVPEAERLLVVAPEDFVAERTALARRLRDDGRAAAVTVGVADARAS